ncbi:MAG: carbonic anhydrase [Campylobacterales bacterium]|nr:carbonic anhydrase [Campylobacterales bacterium]
MHITDLIHGNRHFQKVRFPHYEEDMSALVRSGQKPQILFIGCSDSRVTPDLMLDTKPGDMFILRNVGNFVPPYSQNSDFHGSSAVIEYAVSILNVRHIILCGHSHCGACRNLFELPVDAKNYIHLNKWLELGESARNEAVALHGNLMDREQLYRETEKLSILHQLENLLTFPEIERRVEAGELSLHGWYYQIEDGSILCYDGNLRRFIEPE